MSNQQRGRHEEKYERLASQCIATPATYLVMEDTPRFYPTRLTRIGETIQVESLLLDEKPVSFSDYNEALSFCQHIPHVRSRLSYISWKIASTF